MIHIIANRGAAHRWREVVAIGQISPETLAGLTASQLAGITAISYWNLDDVKARVKARMGWSDGLADEAAREYRKFMALVALNPDKTFGMVEVVDEIWHQHILKTRDYLAMCNAAAGGMIHHEQQPFASGVEPSQVQMRQQTLEALARAFEGPVSGLWTDCSNGESYAKCCSQHIDTLPNTSRFS